MSFIPGRTTKGLITSIIKNLQGKLEGWKGNAKLALIKSVVQSVPLYYLALIEPPKNGINAANKFVANFFWNDFSGNIEYIGLNGPKYATLMREVD